MDLLTLALEQLIFNAAATCTINDHVCSTPVLIAVESKDEKCSFVQILVEKRYLKLRQPAITKPRRSFYRL